jgi:hypothetical protein
MTIIVFYLQGFISALVGVYYFTQLYRYMRYRRIPETTIFHSRRGGLFEFKTPLVIGFILTLIIEQFGLISFQESTLLRTMIENIQAFFIITVLLQGVFMGGISLLDRAGVFKPDIKKNPSKDTTVFHLRLLFLTMAFLIGFAITLILAL